MNINLRDLQYFEVIAELGHLGRAAERLRRTQPALTKAIARLEETFGAALFERDGRGIRLTAVGVVLAARARRVRGATEEALREVCDFASGNAGHVRIGAGPIAASHVLPPVCELLLAEAPLSTLEITIGPSTSLLGRLRDGELDLTLGLLPGDDPAITTEAIVEDEVVVVASDRHPVFDRPRITLRALLDWPWVLPARPTESRLWLDAVFQGRGLPLPQPQIETNSIPLLPGLIARGTMLSFVSRHTLAGFRSRASLREVRLKETTLHRQLGLVYRRDVYLSPAALRLITLLRGRGRALFADAAARAEA